MSASKSAKLGEFGANWGVLLAATLGCAAGLSSLPFYSLGVFIAPLQAEFGWGRGAIGSSFLYTSITVASLSPLLGWAVDRFGPRLVALVSSPLLAVVLFLLSKYDGPIVGFFALYALAAVVGCGTTPVSYTRAVCFAFERRRGLALGMAIGGIGVVAIVLPPVLQKVIGDYGWRGGYRFLALLALLPWPILFFGLKQPHHADPRRDANFGDAMRSRVFWTIGIIFTLTAIAVSGLTVHMVPLLRDAGLTPMAAAGIASLIGVGVLVGRLALGFAIDYLFAPRAAATVFMSTAIGSLLLLKGNPALAPLAALLIGLSLGAEVDLISYLTAKYFGLAKYGSVYALLYAAFLIGAAVGPASAGFVFDLTGSYFTAVWGAIALLVIGCVGSLTLPAFPNGQDLGAAREAADRR